MGAERQANIELEKREKAAADRRRKEDAERLEEMRWKAQEEERKQIEAERREIRRQRMLEERKADEERRKELLLARKMGLSWKSEVAESQRQREEEMEKENLTQEQKDAIERRKTQIEEAARKRGGYLEE